MAVYYVPQSLITVEICRWTGRRHIWKRRLNTDGMPRVLYAAWAHRVFFFFYLRIISIRITEFFLRKLTMIDFVSSKNGFYDFTFTLRRDSSAAHRVMSFFFVHIYYFWLFFTPKHPASKKINREIQRKLLRIKK